MSHPHDEKITMPAEKAYYLQRIELLGELQSELVSWSKKRFWALSAIVIGIGVIGGGSLLTTLVEMRVSAQIATEVARYQAKLDELRETTAIARNATSEAEAAAESVEVRYQQFEEQAQILDARAKAVSNTLSEASAKGFQISEDIRARVDELSQLVETIAQNQEATTHELENVAKKANQIGSALDAQQEEISAATDLVQMTKYPVKIRKFSDTSQLEVALKDAGYSTYIHRSSGDFVRHDGNETIWIGQEVPKDVALRAITIAKTEYPFLKYLALDTIPENFSEIFVGANSDWGEANGVALTEGLVTSLEEAATQDEFHRLLKPTGLNAAAMPIPE